MHPKAQVPLWRSSKLEGIANVRHAFFGRAGGVSPAPYQSLNVSTRVGDDDLCVAQNRARALKALGFLPQAWRNVQQVHGNALRWVDARDDARALGDAASDAMATSCANAALAIFTADCVPLLFAERFARGVAAVHAGWRGVAAKIAQRSVHSLCNTLKTDPRDVIVAIGPAIGPCCFEVGDEVVVALSDALGLGVRETISGRSAKKKDSRAHLDLWALNVQQLVAAGVPQENIDVIRRCTVCENQHFFSHRKERGVCGRQAAVIALASPTSTG